MTDPASTPLRAPVDSGFGIDNLPYGIFRSPALGRPRPRVGVAVGDHVLDLATVFAERGVGVDPAVFAAGRLNPLMDAGSAAWATVRSSVQELLLDEGNRARIEPHLIPLGNVELMLPIDIPDYVDFYSSRHHADNVGRIFRPDGDPLMPNWLHLPVGYHGRAGTVVVSGSPIRRPTGQRAGEGGPVFGPSAKLDIEAEVGFVIGAGSDLGSPVSADEFRDRVFGVVLVNDWSARDIQAWEYQPLGPFLGKSFATSISPWVVPMAALSEAFVPAPAQDPPPLPYLRESTSSALDIELEILWNDHVVSRPPFREMYWTPGQQLAHLTVNGASLRTGDLYASGTVSGPARNQRGSLLELTWNARDPIVLGDGSARTFLEDGDTIRIRATAPSAAGGRLALGEVTGTICPALPSRA